MPEPEQRVNETKHRVDRFSDLFSIFGNQVSAAQTYWKGLSGYTNDFFIPYLLATQYFQRVEVRRLLKEAPAESIQAYMGLLENNIELMKRRHAENDERFNVLLEEVRYLIRGDQRD